MVNKQWYLESMFNSCEREIVLQYKVLCAFESIRQNHLDKSNRDTIIMMIIIASFACVIIFIIFVICITQYRKNNLTKVSIVNDINILLIDKTN